MNQLRGDFLADAAFAGDQDLGIGAAAVMSPSSEREAAEEPTKAGGGGVITAVEKSRADACSACVNSAR